ncbi:MAG: fibronectin type III domain-containing protein [Mogibacterium sp.]|nr:fibronectin type III domain-containing protein [Mogibacterium sp.]
MAEDNIIEDNKETNLKADDEACMPAEEVIPAPADDDLPMAPVLTEKQVPHHKAAKPRKLKIRGPIYHSIHHFHRLSRRQKRKRLRIGLILLVLMTLLTGYVIYKDYHERPGILERSSLKAIERTDDSITLQWQGTRNTETYAVFYKPADAPAGDWTKITVENEKGSKDSAVIEDLEEGTKYAFVVRPDSEDRKGFSTKPKYYSTRIPQKIKGKEHYTKLTCSKDFKLDIEAATKLTFKSDDESVIKVDKNGKAIIKGDGTAHITVTAAETKDYLGDEFETEVEVIESYTTSAGGASAHIIYYLGQDNCEAVKYIAGSGGAVIPQAFGYTGEKYIVAYGMSGSQRIISFDKDGDGKSVSVPGVSLGHPNGFCYDNANKTCYCVKGWSGRAVTYKPETGEYGVVYFPNGASGIGYDRAEDLIYTCSRTVMAAYSIGENGITTEHRCGVVRHSVKTFTQDCGGHAGVMMRCLSGSSKHGTNYVDLYDMKHGYYLGTLACDLSEVESATVDDDGYLLLLSNYSSSTDIIWKTPINIEDIGNGLQE